MKRQSLSLSSLCLLLCATPAMAEMKWLESGISEKMFCNRPHPLVLAEAAPAAIKKAPGGLRAPRYATLTLGPKDSPATITILFDEVNGRPDRVYVDGNGNGDFSDDAALTLKTSPTFDPDSNPATSYTANAMVGIPFASGKKKGRIEFFQKLDANHDGRISFEEFQSTGPEPLHPRMRQVFESMKPDAAGTLTFDDATKVIATVSGVWPKMDPDLAGEFGVIPLEVHPQTKRAFIKVSVNGVEGVFLLDTGTSHTIIHPDFANRAKADFVEACQRVTAGNMGKPGDFVSLVRVSEMKIGSAQFQDFHVVLKPAKSQRYEFGKPIDGVLGASVIFAKPVTLDYRHDRMTYQPAPTQDAQWTLPLIETGQPTPTAEADIDGVKVKLMFDSGAAINDAILVNEPYHAAFRKLAGDPQAKSYTAKSVKVAGQEIDSNIHCMLNPFECTVVSSVFFEAHLISVDRAARKLFITPQPAIK